MTMKSVLVALVAGTVLSGACAIAASGQTAAPVKLWRLDCGKAEIRDINRFSDTHAYPTKPLSLTSSCYLIKHGDAYMLWDTGLSASLKGAKVDPKAETAATLAATLPEQLDKLGVKPDQISIIGISHYHFDHTGQAASFPGATLMIGKGDFDALAAKAPGTDATPLKNWIGGPGKSEAVSGDKDVFGDGSVTMIDSPGHTPGHHALLVRLAGAGPILLSGDATHFQENYASDGVPTFNFNRADTLASLARFKALAKNLKATVIIQHDPRDIAKLPAFPAAAE